MRSIKWEKWQNIFSNNDEDSQQHVVLNTPIGLVSHKLSSNADGSLNFWVGNCDFDIDTLEAEQIINTPGVEIFTIFSPYRFRVCIGENFKTKTVLKNIEKSVGCEKGMRFSESVKKNVLAVKKQIMHNQYWTIYILPNGSFEYISSNKKENFIEQHIFFTSLKNNIGGKLLSSCKY